jgi:hypothetical protein
MQEHGRGGGGGEEGKKRQGELGERARARGELDESAGAGGWAEEAMWCGLLGLGRVAFRCGASLEVYI